MFYNDWNIEIPCTCLKALDFKQNVSVFIPESRNSIVAVCSEGETIMIRFVGFQTGIWELRVNSNLVSDGG